MATSTSGFFSFFTNTMPSFGRWIWATPQKLSTYLGISMLNRNKGFGKNINNQGARVSGCYFVTSYVGLN